MRRVTSDADRAAACPLCHAQPGRPCGWKGAVYPGVVHRERKREAERQAAADLQLLGWWAMGGMAREMIVHPKFTAELIKAIEAAGHG